MKDFNYVRELIFLIIGTTLGTLFSNAIKGIIKKVFGKWRRDSYSKQVVKGNDNITLAQSGRAKIIKSNGGKKN